jgi:hypothetical protein
MAHTEPSPEGPAVRRLRLPLHIKMSGCFAGAIEILIVRTACVQGLLSEPITTKSAFGFRFSGRFHLRRQRCKRRRNRDDETRVIHSPVS